MRASSPVQDETLPGDAPVSVTPPPRRRWLNSALIVILATVLSRGLGLLRDVVLTNQFGTGPDLAAYKAAFNIPDLLYTLIIGGALGSSLIPVFSRFLGQKEDDKAWQLANTVVNYTLLVLTVAAGLAWLTMPTLVTGVLAPHYPPEVQDLTVRLARLLLLQPFFIGLGGITLALLNGSENFLWPALAPLVYNGSIILGALFLVGPFGIYGVTTGVVIGSVLYLLIQLPALLRLGFYWRPDLSFGSVEGTSQVLRTLGPRLVAQGIFQANFIVATNLGSGLDNGTARVTAFNLAYQLFMLPHGIFAISLATVAFPAMARLLGAGDQAGMKNTLGTALRQVLFFTLPAAVGMGVLAKPIVQTVYQSGKFGSESTLLVSQTLLCFSFGLVSYGVVEILTRAFYALQDTRTPLLVALIVVAFNFVLSLILIRVLSQSGLALALTLSTTGEMVGLAVMLYRRLGPLPGLLLPTLKIGAAAFLMGFVIWLADQLLQKTLDDANKLLTIILTGLLVALGGGVYLGAAYLLRIEELRGAIRRFVRR